MTLPQRLSDAPRAGVSQLAWDGLFKTCRRQGKELLQLKRDLDHEQWLHGHSKQTVERLRKDYSVAYSMSTLSMRTLWEESPHNGCAGDDPGTCPACLAIDKFEKWTEEPE